MINQQFKTGLFIGAGVLVAIILIGWLMKLL